MTFTVTYRVNDGTLREKTIEAAGRAECFAQCKARGITPASVREGGNVGDATTISAMSRGGFWRMVILTALSLAAIGGAWWWFAVCEDTHHSAENPRQQVRVTYMEKTPLVSPKSPQVPVDSTIRDSATTAMCLDGGKMYPKPGHNHTPNVYTNDPNFAGHESNMVFKTTADQLLAMVWSAGNSPIPPLPISSGPRVEADFKEALSKPIEILDDDSDAVRDVKMQIHELRGEVLALLDKGYTVQQILMEHQALYNENMKIRTEILMERDRMFDRGDEEGAREYVKRVNAELKKLGIDAIPDPVPVAQRKLSKRERIARRKAETEAKEKMK